MFPGKKTFNVFIVDDDQFYLAALGFRLMKESKNNGTKIYCYATGEECLRNMDLDPSVVILDYNLDSSTPASMSGLRTLRKIKAIKPDVDVILLSAQSDIDVALEIYEAGAYSYIIKDKQALASVEKTISELLLQKKPGHEPLVDKNKPSA
ncbi:MAG: response regulator [Bacteroidota bacterium]|nr:response regulator [Bacteroidota bacterium]